MTNKKIINYIYNCFGNDNILVCGGLADFYWIKYGILSDFDLIIKKDSLLNFFEISNPINQIVSKNFILQKRVSNKFIKDFYQGKIFDTPIDIFFTENWDERKILLVDGSRLGIKENIQIDDPEFRLKILKEHLLYQVESHFTTPEKEWVIKKQNIAKYKIPLYERLLDEKRERG